MLRQLTWLLGLLIALSAPANADTSVVALTPEEAYQAAAANLEAGQSEVALGLASALLQRDPNDYRALIVTSRAARNLSRFKDAVSAGRAAWRNAETEPEKYTAAMVTAQALASDGRKTLSQVWLRRAADTAPNEGTRAVAVRDFRYVRARNPWSNEFSFNIAPSSNINNGSARETTQLFGLPFEFQLSGDARALSGIEYAAGFASRYRFSQAPSFAHDVVLQFNHRTYSLSADAKAQAPGVSGSDFAFTQAALAYVYQREPEGGLGPYALNATAGQSWYGGDAYFSYVRFGGIQKVKIGPRAILSFSGSAERQFGASAADADILRADLRLARQTGSVGVLGLTLGHTTSISDLDIADYSELRTGVDFRLAKPVLGAKLSFGLQMRQRDYPFSRLDPTGRQDREFTASIDMIFTGIDRYGFNPTLSIESSRTDSNIGLYDNEKLGIQFGIRSAF